MTWEVTSSGRNRPDAASSSSDGMTGRACPRPVRKLTPFRYEDLGSRCLRQRGADGPPRVGNVVAQAGRNARLMALLEQVATVDERFATVRRERSEAFLARNARAIRRVQRAGLADTALDPGWPRWRCPPWSAGAPTPPSLSAAHR